MDDRLALMPHSTELSTCHSAVLARSMVMTKLAQGPTLLPHTIASLVSALSVASRISIRSAALLIEGIIESIRLGTLVGLGLTRRALIAAISSARTMHYVAKGLDWTGKVEIGLDGTARTDKDESKFMAVLDHYTNVGVYVITHVFTLAELFSLAGLSLTSSVASFGFAAAEESVRMLDGLLGSGETSRALAAIIALAKSELTDDPEFATISSQGTVATLTTLTRTLTAFVCLQAATRKRTARETRMRVIYDCTVLDDVGQTCMDDVEEVVEEGPTDDVVVTEQVSTSRRRSRSTSVALHMTQATSPEHEHPVNAVQQRHVEQEETQIYQKLTELCSGGESADEMSDLPTAVQHALDELQERTTSGNLSRRYDFGSSYEIEVSESTTTTTTIVRAVEDASNDDRHALESQLDGYRWEELDRRDAVEDENALALRTPPTPDTTTERQEASTDGKHRLHVVLKTITKKLTQKTRTIRTVTNEFVDPDADEHMLEQSTPKAKKRPSLPGDWPVEEEAGSSEHRQTSPSKAGVRSFGNIFRKAARGEAAGRRRSATSSRRSTPATSPTLSPVLAPVSPSHSTRHSRQHSASSFRLDDARKGVKASQEAEGGRGPTGQTPHLRRAPSLHSIHSVVTTCKHTPATLTEEAEPKASNFPRRHLVDNLQTFMRYSSAAYGQAFLRIMGLGRSRGLDFTFPDTRMPADKHAFAHHAGVPVQDILLDTYSDMQAGIFDNEKISPIVNYIAVDHEREAIVLSCRGSLGLSDLLVDLTCSYEPIHVPNGDPAGHYYVHAGMWHSATRMQRGLVHETIRQALLRHPSYGLVLCGHSLGGGVAALLSILWACPTATFERYEEIAAPTAPHPLLFTPFVTSPTSGLPAGRPIKCYAYGPPCVASLDLQEYCRGLVVSTVHNNDVVPTLSLGLLRDLKTTALNLHEDRHRGTTQEIIGRVVGSWQSKANLTRSATATTTGAQHSTRSLPAPSSISPLSMASYGISSFYDTPEEAKSVALSRAELVAGRGSNKALDPAYCDPALLDPELAEEIVANDYLWSIMRTLRASNDSDKLYPPGDESRRILLRAVDDTVKRFSEPVFGKSLFLDHSPAEYERNLDLLATAVLG
ncbi:hypothetical protein ACM66B_006142 [Microbotryomycetes sp. NB124-2]